MPLVQLKDVSASLGGPALLERINLVIEQGERIGLVGRNGVGKSTLLRILRGDLDVDDGEISGLNRITVSDLPQELPRDLDGTVRDVIAAGAATRESSSHPEDDPDWSPQHRVSKLISVMQLPAEAPFAELSGGFKRRVLLARALACEPHLLLLDEPTNHLDIDTIEWLERFLLGLNTTLLVVTHDRAFIDRIATRIVELDRGQLTSWPGDYRSYIQGKEKLLQQEQRHDAAFDKKLAEEERWIRAGLKARRRRNQGRVRALEELRRQRRARRERAETARFRIDDQSRSGRLVAETVDLGFGYRDEDIVTSLSTTIMRGDKVGVIGPNGCGKSTLIKLLTGELKPTSGRIRHGTRLETASLDQERGAIVDARSALDNVSEGRSRIDVNGKSRHIISYMQDFLFAPERARSPAASLSGGERNRLMLAKLFSRPFNLLILDEPTNDLDIETLELLEQLLIEYRGTLILVSHDRSFLDNVVTSTLVFEGAGRVGEYVGGYTDWQRQKRAPQSPDRPAAKPKPKPAARNRGQQKRKLSYNEQRELQALPGEIEALERQLSEMQRDMAEPDFYRRDQDAIAAATAKLKQLETSLADKYARWEEIEST